MNYVVAIPSFKRSKLLVDKTLTMLKTGGVPHTCIHVFVANKEEANNYKTTLPSDMYAKIVIGKPGITPQRRFIVKYFAEGTNVVSIDDDVACMYKRVSSSVMEPLKDVHGFFQQAFTTCYKEKLYLWGVYPVLNAFFMKPGVSYDLKFVIATLYGFINRHDQSILPSVGEKEDFEMSILYYRKDGGVVRFNDIGIKTKFHNPNGGLGHIKDRFEVNEKAAQALKKKYPEYGFVWHRKNGMAEFRLNRKPRMTTSSS